MKGFFLGFLAKLTKMCSNVLKCVENADERHFRGNRLGLRLVVQRQIKAPSAKLLDASLWHNAPFAFNMIIFLTTKHGDGARNILFCEYSQTFRFH